MLATFFFDANNLLTISIRYHKCPRKNIPIYLEFLFGWVRVLNFVYCENDFLILNFNKSVRIYL